MTRPHAASKKTRLPPFLRHALTAGVFVLSLLFQPAIALAAKPKNAPAASQDRKKDVSKVTHRRSTSEETRAERDRRLYRECKGMHNAGACRGYTDK